MTEISSPPLSLYIHWPFCKSKCPYCDFNSHVRDAINVPALEAAYIAELEYFARRLVKRELKTIFFGGGTPSLMPSELMARLIERAKELFATKGKIEITFEANPTSAEAKNFEAFKSAGANRVSIGVQSLVPDDLKFLGREHNVAEALATIQMAKEIFSRFSFDLIYARPKQTLEKWREELAQGLAFGSKHLSAYQLTIEKGTPFYQAYEQKKFELPELETAALMYEATEKMLLKQGLHQYEISNYAAKGQESQHNLCYWRYDEYLGIGPGAHSRLQFNDAVKRSAVTIIHQPEAWLAAVQKNGHGIQVETALTPKEIAEECVMMGLRLTEPFPFSRLRNLSEDALNLDKKKLETLAKQGLIELSKNELTVTKSGRLVQQSILKFLLS